MKSKTILPLILVLAAIGAGTWYYTHYKTAPALPAYNTAVLDSNGNTVNISDLKGQYVLISYFQTWCGDCLREMPAIQNLQNIKGKDRLKVLLVTDEDPAKIRLYRSRFNIGLDVYYSAQPLKNDIKVFPTTYLLDKEGRVIMSKLEGYRWDNEEVLKLIRD